MQTIKVIGYVGREHEVQPYQRFPVTTELKDLSETTAVMLQGIAGYGKESIAVFRPEDGRPPSMVSGLAIHQADDGRQILGIASDLGNGFHRVRNAAGRTVAGQVKIATSWPLLAVLM